MADFPHRRLRYGRGGYLIDLAPGVGSGAHRHRHPELEFILVTSGRLRYCVVDRLYDLEAGDLIWLYPGQDHGIVGGESASTLLVAVFRRPLLARTCREPESRPLLAATPEVAACRRLGGAAAAEITGLIDRAFDAPADLLEASLPYLLLRAWHLFLEADAFDPVDLHPAVARAIRLLRDDPAGATMPELARAAGLSYSRLSRVFRQQTGLSLVAYRQRQCLEALSQLLAAAPQRNLLDAALAAGFGSYAQFHRVCRAHTGLSPAAWRRRAT